MTLSEKRLLLLLCRGLLAAPQQQPSELVAQFDERRKSIKSRRRLPVELTTSLNDYRIRLADAFDAVGIRKAALARGTLYIIV
jgi:hypothetical protein